MAAEKGKKVNKNPAVGTSYYVAGYFTHMHGKSVPFFIDTGSDVSLCCPSHAEGLTRIPLTSGFGLKDFSGNTNVSVGSYVNLEVDFEPGIIKAPFYVCQMSRKGVCILGNDILRHHLPRVSLETSNDILKINTVVLRTKPTVDAAIAEFCRRRELGAERYKLEYARIISSFPE